MLLPFSYIILMPFNAIHTDGAYVEGEPGLESHRQSFPQKRQTDRNMHAANKLLAAQSPHLQGLQSTLLSQCSFASLQESGV